MVIFCKKLNSDLIFVNFPKARCTQENFLKVSFSPNAPHAIHQCRADSSELFRTSCSVLPQSRKKEPRRQQKHFFFFFGENSWSAHCSISCRNTIELALFFPKKNKPHLQPHGWRCERKSMYSFVTLCNTLQHTATRCNTLQHSWNHTSNHAPKPPGINLLPGGFGVKKN